MARYAKHTVGELKAKLAKLSQKNPPALKLTDLIGEIKSHIEVAQKNGHVLKDVCSILNESGIRISESTLATYLTRSNKSSN